MHAIQSNPTSGMSKLHDSQTLQDFLNWTVVRAHALLGPALPVKVIVEHALPAMCGQIRLSLGPRSRAQTPGSLPPLGSFISHRQDVVTAVVKTEVNDQLFAFFCKKP